MSFLELVKEAISALLAHRLRSLLTTLGIVIGVGAVIAMTCIGQGAKVSVEQTFAAMGTNLVIIMPGSTSTGGVHGGMGSSATLTWDDLKAIRSQIPSVLHTSPQLRTTSVVASDTANWTTAVTGVSEEYFSIRNWGGESGQLLNTDDTESGAKVAVLGQTTASKLFGPGANPIGQTLRIGSIPFQVVGLLESKGQSPFGQDYDDAVFVPVTTFRAKIQGGLGPFIPGTLLVEARSAEDMARTERAIVRLLRERHHIADGQEDDFSVRNMSEIAQARQESTRVLTALLFAIAAVSLVVGGIGIMNIMLVSVTERIREIGLRMAVGARPADIRGQFLLEALLLSLIGGVIGVAAGLFAANQLATAFGFPLLVDPQVVITALVFGSGVGVVFGFYPALKASRLEPLEALRRE